jgi:hypothetical protein
MGFLTTEIWIERFVKTHGNLYDYSKFIYTKSNDKSIIICKIHGEFNIIPNHHRSGSGCSKCTGKGLSNIERIEEYNIVHNYKYKYDKFEYIIAHKKCIITCEIHGDFKMTPTSHKSGHGCPKCSGRLSNSEWIERFISKHNDLYGYDKFIFKGSESKSIITCKIHGDFKQTPIEHRNGKGCRKCSGQGLSDNEWIERFNIAHNYRYMYAKFKYHAPHIDSVFTCRIHGDFKQTPTNHRQGKGCPICNLSKGELSIMNYLSENNINFIREYKFDDCVNNKHLPFDFYLPDLNICIEYDGRQHFESIEFFGGDEGLIYRQKNDLIKDNYCSDNNIKLIRIPYFNYKIISSILNGHSFHIN